MLTGDNGVIGQASKSLIKTDNGRVLENVRLKITEYKGRINDEKITNRLEQLKSDGIIDDQGVVDCKKLIGQKLKTGNGSDNKDVYVIEEDELYYYDKNGNKDYLGNIGKDEEVSDEVDTSIFDITDDGVISIKKEYGYYEFNVGSSVAHWENWTLEELVIPTKVNGIKVKSIASGFLYYNKNIKKVRIPNGVEYIGDKAFKWSGLTSIEIPDSVTTIGNSAFDMCWLLEDVTIGENITNIGEDAFNGTKFLNNYSTGDVYIGKVYYKYKGEMPSGTSINIKEGTKGIASCAFYNHSGLTSVIMPNSVISIGENAFFLCSNLNDITISDNLEEIGFQAFNDTAFYNNLPDGNVYLGKVYYKYKGEMPSGTSIKIEEGTKIITEGVFADCSGLTSVTIPSSVTNIGSGAFFGCSSLTNITIGNGVTSIEQYAFNECSNLTTVNYRGTQEQWNAITKGSNNDSLINATINFNYTGE